MSIIELTNNNFETEVMTSDIPVLIDFWAPWCGPCKMLSPIIDQIAEENDSIKVCKVNVDDESELAVKFSVMSIPTIVVIKNGEVTNRSVGVKSKSAIIEMI